MYLPWISDFENALVSTLRVHRLRFAASNIEIQPVLIHRIKPAQIMNDPRYPFTGLLHVSLLILALPFISPIGPLRNIYRWIPAIRYAPLYAAPLVLDSSFLTHVSNARAEITAHGWLSSMLTFVDCTFRSDPYQSFLNILAMAKY